MLLTVQLLAANVWVDFIAGMALIPERRLVGTKVIIMIFVRLKCIL